MYKALIIDDERPARQAIIALGKWEKYGVEPPLEASNCFVALEMMEKYKPDIVFLDMRLPVMDGLSFLEKAAPAYKNTKFIVISGYDDFTYAQKSLRYGVMEYLLKPVMEKELEQSLARAAAFLAMSGEMPEKESMPEKIPGLSKKSMVAEISSYIEQNYAGDISLSMFSRRYYVTKEYLSRCFKEVVGCGIYEFVTETRMKKAGELLQDTDDKIQAIAEMVGYKDQNYFSRAFKKFYGDYPSKYRAKKRTEE